MKTHFLKTWPEYFQAIENGEKAFEVRRKDRDFNVGDTLILEEFNPTEAPADIYGSWGTYTGKSLKVKVTYVLDGGKFGVEEGFCVLGISPNGFEKAEGSVGQNFNTNSSIAEQSDAAAIAPMQCKVSVVGKWIDAAK